MVTADQLVAHAIGDYVLQSDWMATEKTKKNVAALCHVITYLLPFLFITHACMAVLFIAGTHFVIDRWRLARYVCWAKNWLAPEASRTPSWMVCMATGYPPDRPVWLVTWLLIIADNVMHVIMNGLAIRWFA